MKNHVNINVSSAVGIFEPLIFKSVKGLVKTERENEDLNSPWNIDIMVLWETKRDSREKNFWVVNEKVEIRFELSFLPVEY